MVQKLKIGFVCFGEVNTPYEIIKQKYDDTLGLLQAQDFQVVTTAPVTDDPSLGLVQRAIEELQAERLDSLIVCLAGWIPSHTVIDVIEPFKNLPMILLGLSGWKEGERIITTADQAGTTALRHPMKEMGYKFKYIVCRLGEPFPIDQIKAYFQAVSAQKLLKGSKIGSMGYRDMRLYATLYDGISLKGKYGVEADCFEMLEVINYMADIPDAEVKEITNLMLTNWVFTTTPQDVTLEKTAKLFIAVSQIIKKNNYKTITLIDVDGVKKFLKFAPAGAFMLLGNEHLIPTIPENDFLGSFTQLIVKYLTGQIAAYLEFYEFTKDGAIMGVPDYIPQEITEGDVLITPTAFGDFGEGLLNVSKIKTGEITLLRMATIDGDYCLHAVTATALNPPNWEEAGWKQPAPQLPGLYIKFHSDTENIIQNIFGQHYILAYGNILQALTEFCFITDTKLIIT